MLSTPLPDEAYQLADKYELGQPIRIYSTNKRSMFKLIAWSIFVVFIFCTTIVLIQSHFSFTPTQISFYGIVLAILVFVALIFFIPLLLIRKTTIYICSAGFIRHHRSTYQVVRWEDVAWASSEDQRYTIYLTNQKRPLLLSRLIDNLPGMVLEIETRSRLVNYQESDHLGQQFEQILDTQIQQHQEEMLPSATKLEPATTNKIVEETSRLQEKCQLGELQKIYHAGFKGFLRKESLIKPIIYTLRFALILIYIGGFLSITILPKSVAPLPEYVIFPSLILFFLVNFCTPRFSARNIQLHLYAQGFIYIEGSSYQAIRWEQIEKIIYHKTTSVYSPPFCHIYLPDGGKLALNGYLHAQRTLKQALNEHVATTSQVG